MPDTGERSPTTNSGFNLNGGYAHDENTSSVASTFGFGSAKTHTVGAPAGDDLPEGATVDGVKVFITIRHGIFFSYEAAAITSVKLSLDEGSNYSSNILSSNQNTTTSATEYEFGGATETWGLDWSGFTDISDLKVEFITFTADGGGNHWMMTSEVTVQVYYTEAAASGTTTTGALQLKNGKLSILGGRLVIK